MGLNIRHFLFGITLCALALCSGTASADAPVLDARMDARDSVSLTEYFSVLEDPSGTMTLGELTRPGAPDRFSPSQGRGEALGYSYTRSALWLRLRVVNPGTKALERQLLISYALLAELDFYRPSTDGTGYEHLALGYARPFAARPHKSRFFVLPVHLQAGATQELYLRVATPNSLNVPAQLWKPESLQAHEHRDYFTQALYFGIVIAIAVYNLMLFLALRDISYLLYVGFAGCVSLALAAFTGIGQEFLWRDLPAWSMMGVNVPTALAGIVILAFVRRVLTTADQAPQLDRLLRLFMGLNLLALVLLPLWFRQVTPFFVALSAATSLLLLVTGLICASRRQRSAYYFVAAFTAILLAVMLTHLRNLGVLPTNVFTVDGTQIGSAIEMLLLSFALAERYNALRREKAQAQAGALEAERQLVERLKSSEQQLESRVAERTAELEAANRKLEALSSTDALTGLANRRHFEAALASEWQRAQRSGQLLALGVIDVDWFKLYNDRHGHQAGDACLRRVAELIASCLSRNSDVVARFGGEEFVFIAPATDAKGALNMGRRVCEALQALQLPHEASDYGCVTASIGVAALRPSGQTTPDDLFKAADQAMYRAKREGRNRAVCA